MMMQLAREDDTIQSIKGNRAHLSSSSRGSGTLLLVACELLEYYYLSPMTSDECNKEIDPVRATQQSCLY